MTAGAALFGLPTPRIAAARRPTSSLVDLEAEWEVGEGGYESRSENCCFAGRTLRGRVLLTVGRAARSALPRALAQLPQRDRRERAYVLLEDGTRFDGEACGAAAAGDRRGRLHDRHVRLPGVGHRPVASRGQIITFTYPQIGNYGVIAEAMESDRIHARARDHARGGRRDDAPGAERGWLDWLADCGVPAITGVDTRALVRHIRDARRDAGRRVPGGHARGRGARAHRRRADDGRPRPRRAR